MHKKASGLSLSFSLAICILVGGLPAHAQELSRQAKIETILDLMNSQASVDQMFD